MLLGSLFNSGVKNYKNISIRGISFDSRSIKRNDIFFAIDGNKISGTKFIKEAISKGAAAVVARKNIKNKRYKVPLVLVPDVRKSLAEASSNFYKKKPQNIIAVTGTNGKSSVVDFFYQILSLNKKSVSSIGTLGIISKNYKKKINLTSPDALSLHKNLEILAKKNIKNVILEASSHGLKQKRLDYIKIKTGIFTNISHDHLDYHKNMKSYFKSKMYLFDSLLNKNSNIITDEENNEYKNIKNIAKKRNIKINTIGINSGNIKILHTRYKENKQIVTISSDSKIFNLEIPLIGHFQVKNLLMAILAASRLGIKRSKIYRQLNKIKPVPGRLECVAYLNNNSKIIVDFAHTPDALEQSLLALKNQFKKNITLVFGCGGERDKKKRPIMGRIAKKYCKKIYITDDNPRKENPKKIRNEIMQSCKNICKEVGDRKKAIDLAIKELEPNEVLLIAGRGHETIQDYGSKKINFSDKKIVREIIKKRKLYFKKYNHQDHLLKKIFNKSYINNVNYKGVSINSKTIKKNELFFSIKGKNNDGHQYVKEAIKKGAIKSIISKKINRIPANKIIRVKNTLSSLNELAKVTRENTLAQIIGITGSVGKTTLKNLIAFTLKNFGRVYYSPHSYNNKFGVPLSISNLGSKTDFGVFEIGMDKKGEIYKLSKIVKPEIAVITNISAAHFRNFNTLKDIAKAKSEIIDNITNGGTVILNKDDKFFNFLLKKAKMRGKKVISYSLKKKADIYLLKVQKLKKYYRLKINVKKRIFYFNIKQITHNFVSNILACVSCINFLNLDLKKVEKKFLDFKIPSGRGDVKMVKSFKKRFRFIDESYNANPLSMLSAIRNMKNYKIGKKSKKIVLLGDMLELGKKSKKYHKELSTVINKSDVDKVFVYGNYIKETFKHLSRDKKGKVFDNFSEIHQHFNKIINNNDLLMIKGSNATGMNQFSKNIKKGQIGAI